MHSRFQAALTTLAADLQAAIAPMLADPHFPALLEADQVATLQHATGLDEDALAFALLPLAAACARPDLSHFNVGAIARGVSGRWYFGGNMEFLGATMQQTVHAEQSAISHAWLRGETRGENGDINGYMLAEARRVVDGAARMHGCRSRFLCQSHCPGAMSSPELVDLVERTARDMGSFREVRRKADFWASEDFGWFMNKVQEDGGLAAYLQLGADRPDGHHTSHFTFDESVLPRGLELLARLAVAALARRPD